MTQNEEQHHMFEEGLEAMEKYFGDVQKNPSVYDGNKVIELIETFGDIFCNHLREEIKTLERSKLMTIFPDVEDLKKLWKEMMDWIIKTSKPFTSMPWVAVHLATKIANAIGHESS
jgi:hypothetical protein